LVHLLWDIWPSEWRSEMNQQTHTYKNNKPERPQTVQFLCLILSFYDSFLLSTANFKPPPPDGT